MYNRATAENYLQYKNALCLFKIMNSIPPHTTEWVPLNFNQILTTRQSKFKTLKQNNRRVGLNALANRFLF